MNEYESVDVLVCEDDGGGDGDDDAVATNRKDMKKDGVDVKKKRQGSCTQSHLDCRCCIERKRKPLDGIMASEGESI